MPPVTDVHSHIVTPEVLALLEREGAACNTRIAERDGRRVFVIEDTAVRPPSTYVAQLWFDTIALRDNATALLGR